MTTSAELTDAPPSRDDSAWHKFAVAFGLLWLADILFYDQLVGLSVTLFASALLAGCVLVNHDRIDRRRSILAAGIFVAGLLPAIEALTPLSVLILVLTTITAVALSTDPVASGLWLPVTAARQLLLTGPFRLFPDVIATLRANDFTRLLLNWSIPVALGLVFIVLFAAANPVIEQWLDQLQPQRVTSNLSFGRPIFWLVTLSLIWPFIHLRWRQRKPLASLFGSAVHDDASSLLGPLLGPQTVIRSLVLFNILFAIQTALDGVYLWGHAALPDGMTYAAYAHRGAYPLMITALLAAAFVILAIRSEEPEKSRLVRPLVYLWVGQNLMLVLSSIQRVHLYIESYLLTGWRIAALIWMAVVAVGLVLIVIRIARDHSNRWLIRMNLLVVAATVYGCGLMNFDGMIADYNVTHSREAGRNGAYLDQHYLATLGPQALPAIARAMVLSPQDPALVRIHARLLDDQAKDIASWRSWSFRSWRLRRYLDTHPSLQNPS